MIKIYSPNGKDFIEVTQTQYDSILATAEILADKELYDYLISVKDTDIFDRDYLSLDELKKLLEID